MRTRASGGSFTAARFQIVGQPRRLPTGDTASGALALQLPADLVRELKAIQKRDGAKNSETAIDQRPEERNPANGPADERHQDHTGTGDQAYI